MQKNESDEVVRVECGSSLSTTVLSTPLSPSPFPSFKPSLSNVSTRQLALLGLADPGYDDLSHPPVAGPLDPLSHLVDWARIILVQYILPTNKGQRGRIASAPSLRACQGKELSNVHELPDTKSGFHV